MLQAACLSQQHPVLTQQDTNSIDQIPVCHICNGVALTQQCIEIDNAFPLICQVLVLSWKQKGAYARLHCRGQHCLHGMQQGFEDENRRCIYSAPARHHHLCRLHPRQLLPRVVLLVCLCRSCMLVTLLSSRDKRSAESVQNRTLFQKHMGNKLRFVELLRMISCMRRRHCSCRSCAANWADPSSTHRL